MTNKIALLIIISLLGALLVIELNPKASPKEKTARVAFPNTINPVMYGVTLEYWDKGKRVAVMHAEKMEFPKADNPVMYNVTTEYRKEGESPVIMHTKQAEVVK